MQASLAQKQQLGVKMNPQVYQSIKLMELPLVDLRQKIEEELELNPALEVLEDPSTVSLEETEPEQQEIEEYFETSSDSGFLNNNYNSYSGSAGAAAADEHHHFIEGTLSRPETLQQHLLWQLQLEPVDAELRAIAATLIQNLDDNGFHKEPPETLFKQIDPQLMARAMRLVQGLDPAGCCTANYRESLKIQIALIRDAPDCIECSLDHLDLLEKGKFSIAAKKMGCSEEDVRACFELVKTLSPFPGLRFTAAEVRFVIPDVQVIRNSGLTGEDFAIIINDEVIPVLGINPFFQRLGPVKSRGDKEQDSAGRQAREFARDNVREARVFINSIAMRNNTLKMVSGALVRFQRAFFESGPQYLVPLTLGDIAKELGIHETTVSRTANGKYMQTEWGIFELRYFFTNSISGAGSGGSQFSKEGVKAIIQEMVSAEPRNLSDLDISNQLARRGIPLARRTVAKYRKELDLGSSYTRQR